MTTPASIPTRDLPAVAAYAAANDLDGDAAAIQWKLDSEAERDRHRMIADAAITVAMLHTAPPAALTPGPPPDARALAGIYWSEYMASEPMYREGVLGIERLAPETVTAMEAGVLAVVAEALPSVGLLDDALRKACKQREQVREELKREVADHARFLEELLLNTDGEPDMPDTPEDYAVRYVRRLEDERDRAYRERAALVAFLAACYPAQVWTDTDAPGWPVVAVETPAGQMSWHIADRDMGLFGHVTIRSDEDNYDGHTTGEKYARLAGLTADVAGVRATAASLATESENDRSRT